MVSFRVKGGSYYKLKGVRDLHFLEYFHVVWWIQVINTSLPLRKQKLLHPWQLHRTNRPGDPGQ